MEIRHPGFRRFIPTVVVVIASLGIAGLSTTALTGAAQTLPGLFATAGEASQQAADEDGVTPLMCAARDGERKMLRSLLRDGSDVNSKDMYRWTALTYAARRGDASMIVALANKGADLNNESDDGLTPLMYAASEGYSDAVRVLLERGANVNATSKSGATALTLAEQRSRGRQAPFAQGARGQAIKPDDERDYVGVVEHLKQAGAIAGRSGAQQLLPTVDSRPVALNSPYPNYTEEARRHKVNARIDIRVLVGEDGSVRKVRVLTGAPDGLTEQAVMAANKLRFKPASKDGKPVEFWTPLSMDFNIR